MKRAPCGAISCHLQYELMFGSTQVSSPLLAHHVIWMGGNLLIFALTKSEHLSTWYVLWGQELSPSSPGEKKTTGPGKELEKLCAKEVEMTVNIHGKSYLHKYHYY